MIPLTRPLVDFADVADDIRRICESGVLTRGPYVHRLEELVAAYIGVEHAIATTSATTALHLTLVAAGIGAGDEVLVSDFSFPATGNVVAQCGASPVFVDCAPGSFLADLGDAATKRTAATRAFLIVDPFGQPADLAAAANFAKENRLFLLEDAACALGAVIDEIKCGAWSNAGCFSFHPRKVITTGEGGMVTTNDDALASTVRSLANHGGVSRDVGQTFVENGFNYRMSEFHAAIGVRQMGRVDDLLEGRRIAARYYLERLQDVSEVAIPLPGANASPTFQSFVVLLDDVVDRDAVVARLRSRGIETTLGTYAMHAQPAFGRFGYAPGDLPHSWRAQQQSLTLPLWPGMAVSAVDKVVRELKLCLQRAR